MNRSIRILHLEDSPRDAEIVRDRLEASGLACDITLVGKKAAFQSALEQNTFDIILCDYNLPDYDGFTALTEARAKSPDTPVIIVSGTLGEEEAVRCLHSGATDYLLKQRLERLPTAIRRTLEEAEEHRKRRQAEAALRQSEEQLRQALQAAHAGYWTWDPARNRTRWSPECAALYGIEPPPEFSLQDWLACIHPDDRSRIEKQVQSVLAGRQTEFQLEFRIQHPQKRVRWISDIGSVTYDAAGRPLHVAGINLDITERKTLEAQLLRAQRLESIGSLAAGLAHDLNNAIAPIMMSVEMLRMQYPAESQMLGTIQACSQRCADMVRQLLTFAKGAEGERIPVSPGRLIRELERLMKGSFPKNIQLVVKSDPNLPPVLGDATQLHQVLLNLCVNARDAMPRGGTLTLEAQRMEVDAAYASSVPDAKPGQFIALRVRDTGVGIPPEILDRIFDPFFTTKGPDQGTGLGLSTVLGIVKGHGGFTHVYSKPGQGSTFTVFLPLADRESNDTTPLTEAPVVFRGQDETILFVDDELAMRQMARAVLRHLNFKPLTAADGAEGLMQAAQHCAELRAVITDLHMPHLDGLTLVRTLRRMLPDIPIVVASGRMEDAMAEEFKTLGVTHRLDKPFTEAQLAGVLRKIFGPR